MPLLAVHDLHAWYPVKRGLLARTVGHVRAVDGVSFTLEAGQTLGIVGQSGSGKSTLARALLKLEKPRSGSILLDGQDIARLRGPALRAYRRSVQVVFQDPFASLNPRLTVLQLVTEGMVAHGLANASTRRAAALELLAQVGLDAAALDRYPHTFSGGQRQRVCIARALSLQPRLLICDEAVSALDLSIRAQILNLLLELQKQRGLAYLFITHDLSVVQHVADTMAVMHEGRFVEHGPCADIVTNPQTPYTRQLLKDQLTVDCNRKPSIN